MRIALFFIVNICAAIGVVVYSLGQEHGAGVILLRVFGVFVALQLLYVIWLLGIGLMRPKTRETTSRGPEEDALKATAEEP